MLRKEWNCAVDENRESPSFSAMFDNRGGSAFSAEAAPLWVKRVMHNVFGVGVKSLERIGLRPVGLVHTQNLRFFKRKSPLEVATTRNLLSDVRFVFLFS